MAKINWGGNLAPQQKKAPRNYSGQLTNYSAKGSRMVAIQQAKERQEDEMMNFAADLRKRDDRRTEQLTNYQLLRKLKKLAKI